MKFQKPAVDIIKQRSSCRTYLPEPIEDSKKKEIIDLLSSEIHSPFGSSIRLELVEKTDIKDNNAEQLGTYGIIKGANTFIVGITKRSEMNIEHFGYIFEKIILYATSIGLGTCWLGGTFNRSSFGRKVSLEEHEFIPAVTPIGYPQQNRRIFESLMRTAVGAKNRKPWNQLFFYKDFNNELSIDKAGEYKVPLEMVRLAPSASNKQPWRILYDGTYYHFYLCRTTGYGSVLPYDIQRLDIGIAMCHFDMTSKELGLNGKWIVDNPSNKIPHNGMEYIISWHY